MKEISNSALYNLPFTTIAISVIASIQAAQANIEKARLNFGGSMTDIAINAAADAVSNFFSQVSWGNGGFGSTLNVPLDNIIDNIVDAIDWTPTLGTVPDEWLNPANYNAANNYGGPGTEAVYNMDYIHNFIGTEVQGAGAEMNALMEDLQLHLMGDTDVDARAVVEEIEALRGQDPDQMWVMYEKIQALYAQLGRYDDLDTEMWPNYLGSNQSLLSGQVVGDSIGLEQLVSERMCYQRSLVFSSFIKNLMFRRITFLIYPKGNKVSKM